MPASLECIVAGETLILHPDRALFWPARKRLMIADLHLGKADVFRRAGIAVPRGGTSHDLQRISLLLARFGATELCVLGDLLHGPTPDAAWREAWDNWRLEHSELQVSVVAGNHDRRLAAAGLDLTCIAGPWLDPPFSLQHEPARHPSLHVVCGHLHPCFAVPAVRRRWPGFWLQPSLLMLPSFSAFTGGFPVTLGPREQAVLCVGDALIRVG